MALTQVHADSIWVGLCYNADVVCGVTCSGELSAHMYSNHSENGQQAGPIKVQLRYKQ